MATFGYRTKSDLTGLEGRWVTFVSPDLVGINDVPGTPSLGVLVRLYTFGGVQWAQIDSGVDLHEVQAAGIYAQSDPLTNDAAGASVVAGPDDAVSGIALEASTGPGPRKVFAFSGNPLAGLFAIRERFHFSTWIDTPGGIIDWNLANDGSDIHTGSADRIRYPLQIGPIGATSAGISAILGKNTMDADSILRLIVNDVPTGLFITIPAGVAGRFDKFAAQLIPFDGWVGLALETTASAGGEITMGATLLVIVT